MNAPQPNFGRKPAAPKGWTPSVRLELEPRTEAQEQLENFTVPIQTLRRAIADHYARGIYHSEMIASGVDRELRQAGGLPVRVDSALIREVRRREKTAIESDLAAMLSRRLAASSNSTGNLFANDRRRAISLPRWCATSRLSAASCIREARERVRLATWLDKAKP